MLESTRIPGDVRIVDLSVTHHAGRSVVVCVDYCGEVWTWYPSTGELATQPLPYAHAVAYSDGSNNIDMLAALSVDGELLVAAGGDEQEPAAWNLGTGDLLWRTPLNGDYLAGMIAVDGGFVTAQQYSEEVRLWSPDGVPTTLGEVYDLRCLGSARVGGRSLILAGGFEIHIWDAETLSVVKVWDEETREDIGSFYSSNDRVYVVTACELADRVVVLAGTIDNKLYAWDLDSGFDERLYRPVTVSNDSLSAMAVMMVAGRPLVLTRDRESVRLWNVADGTDAGHLRTRHKVTAMTTADIDGLPALVTSGEDGVLRIWDDSDLAASVARS